MELGSLGTAAGPKYPVGADDRRTLFDRNPPLARNGLAGPVYCTPATLVLEPRRLNE